MTRPPPLGPGFTSKQASEAETIEIHGSSLDGPGPDFCEFVLKAKDGHVVATRRIGGY